MIDSSDRMEDSLQHRVTQIEASQLMMTDGLNRLTATVENMAQQLSKHGKLSWPLVAAGSTACISIITLVVGAMFWVISTQVSPVTQRLTALETTVNATSMMEAENHDLIRDSAKADEASRIDRAAIHERLDVIEADRARKNEISSERWMDEAADMARIKQAMRDKDGVSFNGN